VRYKTVSFSANTLNVGTKPTEKINELVVVKRALNTIQNTDSIPRNLTNPLIKNRPSAEECRSRKHHLSY
jgi:hypothetical protein